MSCLKTYTGKVFSIDEVSVDDLDIRDIAHALSLVCRGNGQVIHFYSVAQHCLNCVQEAKKRGYDQDIQLACLLHDASEAYMADLIRPVKEKMPIYHQIENHLLSLVGQKFNCHQIFSKQVKEIDDAMCEYDLEYLLQVKGAFHHDLEIVPSTDYVAPRVIEEEYLKVFTELSR